MAEESQTLTRAFAVLSCFRDAPDDLGASDIARRAGLSTSTAHRLARTMVGSGFLEQDAASSRYRLGATLAELGQLVQWRHGAHLADPELRRLARRTHAVAGLAIRRTTDAVLVAQAPRDGALGLTLPLHASAMGKVLLAWGAPLSLGDLDLAPRTERTLTDPAALRAEVDAVRAAGHAVSDEELERGYRTVAVPVFDASDDLAFALGVRGTADRLQTSDVDDIAREARAAASRIQEALAS